MNPDDDTRTPSAGSDGPTARSRPSGADRARDEMIADIDGRLRRHERTATTRLDELNTTVRESAGLLAETLPRLDDLVQAVAEVSGRVDTLAGRSPDSAAVLPVRWPTLTPEEAEKAWSELADWVGTVLGPWYQIRRGQVPDCWALHSVVVLHLSWLHRAWLAAHTGPAATPTAAAEWHVRWLPAALDAIGAVDRFLEGGRTPWITVCRPGYHLNTAHPTERGPMDRHLQRTALPHEDLDAVKSGRPLSTIAPKEDPMDRRHWHNFWTHAVAADLAWRRERGSTPQVGGG